MKDSRPTGLSQELWEQAGAAGIDVWQEEDGRIRMHAGGGIFPTLDPDNAEERVQAALDETWNDYNNLRQSLRRR